MNVVRKNKNKLITLTHKNFLRISLSNIWDGDMRVVKEVLLCSILGASGGIRKGSFVWQQNVWLKTDLSWGLHPNELKYWNWLISVSILIRKERDGKVLHWNSLAYMYLIPRVTLTLTVVVRIEWKFQIIKPPTPLHGSEIIQHCKSTM